jgi:hypothetical protein
MVPPHRFARALSAFVIGTLVAIGAVVGASPASAATAILTLSPTSGPVGTEVSVTGTGFTKKTTGTVTAGTARAAFTTSASGYFTVKIRIPTTTSTTLPVTATAGARTAAASFSVTGVGTPPPGVPPISTARLQFGLATPGGATANAELDAVATVAGESPSMVLSYYDFTQPPPIADLESVAARGATSLITWEPWRWGGGLNQGTYTNAAVASGAFDAYLKQWGAALATWGKPVYLRYGHEMNGNWYPWAEGVNSNAAGSYVAAWKHVHDVLAAQGATNVMWVWSPNVPYTGSTALTGLYPGAAYVDVVALDGYNWGTSQTWSSWVAPSALFGEGIAQLRALAPGTPILIAETASAEIGGSKADWNTALVAYLNAQPDVVGFIWFHYNKEVDWRITSTSSSSAAFATALQLRRG